MFSALLMGGGGHARERDHKNVKSLIIFARDCRVVLVASATAIQIIVAYLYKCYSIHSHNSSSSSDVSTGIRAW
jgi:hypothetical protein